MAEKHRMTVELRGEQRADGCYHLKSAELPGFHFIVGPDEPQADFERPLADALRAFIPQLLKAQAQRQAEQSGAFRITRSRSTLNLTAELEFA